MATGVRVYVPVTPYGAPVTRVRTLTIRNATTSLAIRVKWVLLQKAEWNAEIGAWEFALQTLARTGVCLFEVVARCDDRSTIKSAPFHISHYLPSWLFVDAVLTREELIAEFEKQRIAWFSVYTSKNCTFVHIGDPKEALRYRFLPASLMGLERELITLMMPTRPSAAVFLQFESAVRDCASVRQASIALKAFIMPGKQPVPAAPASLKRPRKDVWPSTDADESGMEHWPGVAARPEPRIRPVLEEPPFPLPVRVVGTNKYILPKNEVNRLLSLLRMPARFEDLFEESFIASLDSNELYCYETLPK